MKPSKLEDLRCAINNGLASNTYDTAKKYSLFLPCNKSILAKEFFLYAWCISDWEQNSNGTTTGLFNYITDSDMEDIYERVTPICGCP